MDDIGRLAVAVLIVVAAAVSAIGPVREFRRGAADEGIVRLATRLALFVAACWATHAVQFIEPRLLKWALLIVVPVVVTRLAIWLISSIRARRRGSAE